MDALLRGLSRSKQVRILGGDGNNTHVAPLSCSARLPTISFVHATISPRTIVTICEAHGIGCRYSSFLCTPHLARDFDFDHSEGVVRVSLAHYNTLLEVQSLVDAVASIPDWF